MARIPGKASNESDLLCSLNVFFLVDFGVKIEKNDFDVLSPVSFNFDKVKWFFFFDISVFSLFESVDGIGVLFPKIPLFYNKINKK
jgi:hypothetical protein